MDRPLSSLSAALLAPAAARLGATSARRAVPQRWVAARPGGGRACASTAPPSVEVCRQSTPAGVRTAPAPLPADPPPPTLAARAVAVLAAAAVAVASGGAPALAATMTAGPLATASGDALLAASKKADAAADAVVGVAAGLLPRSGGTDKQVADAAAAEALLREVHDVVASNYMDARGRGLDAAAWDAALDRALAARPRDAAAARRAVRQMLAFGLDDPYTRYLSPEEFRAMARYDITGVGLNLGSADEYERRVGAPAPRAPTTAAPAAGAADRPTDGVWVIGLVRGSPADAAGVGQGDRVVAVGRDAVAPGASPFAVASAIAAAGAPPPSSPPSSSSRTVTLDVVKPDGRRVGVTLAAPAAPAAVSPVAWRLDRGGAPSAPPVAVIRLQSFNARAKSDVEAALAAADAAGAGGVVLDLRGNRGGLVAEGVEVAGLFLPPGAPVAVTLGATPDAERVLRVAGGGGGSGGGALPVAAPGARLRRAPLTVLIDDRTASAAEIVAGALRDNCRAVLVGGGGGLAPPLGGAAPTRTYGKGLIQSVYELGDASGLVLTVGKYLTPARVDIDRGGIAADVRGAGAAPAAAADAVLGACRRAAKVVG